MSVPFSSQGDGSLSTSFTIIHQAIYLFQGFSREGPKECIRLTLEQLIELTQKALHQEEK